MARRYSGRTRSDAGGPFALPRRKYDGDVDVGMEDVSGNQGDEGAQTPAGPSLNKRVQTMPTLPKTPSFRGSTSQDKQNFMKKYEAYCRQLSALETAFFRPFRMLVGACVEDERRRRFAMFDICKPLDEITESDWINFVWEGRVTGKLDFDNVKALVKWTMDVHLTDAYSRVSKLAHEIYQILKKKNMEWMIEEEPKKIVGYLIDTLAPEQFRRTAKNRMARESNKPLMKNVVRFIKWLRSSCKEYLRREPKANQRKQSGAKPTKIPKQRSPSNFRWPKTHLHDESVRVLGRASREGLSSGD
ncbi:hypothetical protein PHMEG_0003468 [Phytophthora megakarya]|uniref:Uncharacterized protein n=1 Tax=Phytophthora megakarya TaxID=4795 RepID=A0A225WW88_9STRA|nr:hypothetical protein PHMEG_0003468 [Phytophthora megakarya]